MKQGGTAVYPSLAVIAEDVFIWKRGLAVDTRRRWRMVMETELEIKYKKSDDVKNGEKMMNTRFGEFGGQYIPEILMSEINHVAEAYEKYKNDPAFKAELKDLYANYTGRPSMLYEAKRMRADLGGPKIYLKREDLNHTGAHKINNCIGQALLAKRMEKHGSLRKRELVSMVWLQLLSRRFWGWNVKYSWEKLIRNGRR